MLRIQRYRIDQNDDLTRDDHKPSCLLREGEYILFTCISFTCFGAEQRVFRRVSRYRSCWEKAMTGTRPRRSSVRWTPWRNPQSPTSGRKPLGECLVPRPLVCVCCLHVCERARMSLYVFVRDIMMLYKLQVYQDLEADVDFEQAKIMPFDLSSLTGGSSTRRMWRREASAGPSHTWPLCPYIPSSSCGLD